MNGETTTRGQLFNDTRSTSVQLVALGTCDLAVFAVGGGGTGYSSNGGKGSGFIQFSLIRFIGTIEVNVRVGEDDERSVLSVEGKSEVVALPGETSYSDYDGGAGYCGGGGGDNRGDSTAGDGGAGGGDGQDSYRGTGGKGSGLDVGSIFLKDFAVT